MAVETVEAEEAVVAVAEVVVEDCTRRSWPDEKRGVYVRVVKGK